MDTASSGEVERAVMRYAAAAVAERDMPAWQWTRTAPAVVWGRCRMRTSLSSGGEFSRKCPWLWLPPSPFSARGEAGDREADLLLDVDVRRRIDWLDDRRSRSRARSRRRRASPIHATHVGRCVRMSVSGESSISSGKTAKSEENCILGRRRERILVYVSVSYSPQA